MSKHTCNVCHAEGHDIRTCTQREVQPVPARTSASKRAAEWLHDEGGPVSFTAAGHRFGVTREAVRQAWGLLYPGEKTPWQVAMAAREQTILDLAANGMTITAIARELGIPAPSVRTVFERHGIPTRRAA